MGLQRMASLTGQVLALALAAVVLHWPATAPAGAATAPNGLIAYAAWDLSGNHDVWVTDPADPEAEPVRLTADGRYNNNPDWSPDGTRIAYDGFGEFGGPRIWSMDANPATNDWAPLSAPPCTEQSGCFYDFQPAWSPDGEKVAFASNRSPDGWAMGGYELFVMDAAGEAAVGPAQQLTDTRTTDQWKPIDWYASWSPDSSRLVFASSRDEGRLYDFCDLYVMDATDADGDGEGDNLRRITFDSQGAPFSGVSCDLLQPAWSPVPGSSLVTFASTRAGSHYDIWVVDVDDPKDLRNVTQSPEEIDDTPGWSPDGTQVIYRSSRSEVYELWSLPLPEAATAEPAASEPRVAAFGAATVAVEPAASEPKLGTLGTAKATAVSPEPTRLTANGGTEDSPEDEQDADWGPTPVRTASRTDVGVFRPSNGVWFTGGDEARTVAWGTTGDVAVPADYDGNGDADIAVFRPGNGVWLVHGGATVSFGTKGDIPVPADYDGDGDADIAVFRPGSGVWFVQGGPVVQFGANGDIPVAADYDGDGDADIAVFRPGSGIWFVREGATIPFGTKGDVPLTLPAPVGLAFFTAS